MKEQTATQRAEKVPRGKFLPAMGAGEEEPREVPVAQGLTARARFCFPRGHQLPGKLEQGSIAVGLLSSYRLCNASAVGRRREPVTVAEGPFICPVRPHFGPEDTAARAGPQGATDRDVGRNTDRLPGKRVSPFLAGELTLLVTVGYLGERKEKGLLVKYHFNEY